MQGKLGRRCFHFGSCNNIWVVRALGLSLTTSEIALSFVSPLCLIAGESMDLTQRVAVGIVIGTYKTQSGDIYYTELGGRGLRS